VECPEFRVLLLLLRNDLKETMIPHRTKLRELIIKAWQRYFQVLKKDLEVLPYLMHSLLFINIVILFRMLLAESRLLPISGPIKIADLTSQLLGTGLQNLKGQLPYN
jgi:hypothetical protein